MKVDMFISSLLNGINIGSIYALIALGYTMVYGIAKMLNFAHGDVIMIGGYILFTLAMDKSFPFKIPVYVAIIAAMLFCAVLGVVIEKVAYKPLRNTSSLTVLITAIGVSYLLQNLALVVFGPEAKAFTSVVPESLNIKTENLKITGETIVTVVVTIVIMIVLTLFVNKTKTGRAMRAVSEDKGAAQLMGINVNKTISITFAIGSLLAAVAAVLLCSKYLQVSSVTGQMPGIKAFTAAVFGGIGSVPGAMIGGLVLGIIEAFGGTYISTELANAIVFSVLIIVLLVKPTGLLGKKTNEKV